MNQLKYIFPVSKNSMIRTQKSTLISLTLTEILSNVMLHDKMQKAQSYH